MIINENEKLVRFQTLINYQFKDVNLLKQALTTPKLGNESGIPHYQVLETLGDAVIKLIFSLKLYKKGEHNAGELTKMKQCLENNKTFLMIANKIGLEQYIFASKKQQIKDTKVLADSFEAICGALYLDSDLTNVEEKVINIYFQDWESIIKESSIFNKNKLLEFLQSKYKFTPIIRCEFQNFGPQNALKWIAMNPKIYDQKKQLLIEFPELKSKYFKSKEEAEQDLYFKMLKSLKKESK